MSINRHTLHRPPSDSPSTHQLSENGAGGSFSTCRRLLNRAFRRVASDRGDVPGWVLITLMTAGIVIALWAVASDALVGLFEQAMSQFS